MYTPLKRRLLRAVVVLLIAASPALAAQPPADDATPATQPGPEDAPASAPADPPPPPQRFLDNVTVSATLNPQTVKDTPATVSVIDAATIDRRLLQNAADLVKFEPGVYVESNLTRVGLNGFNIRGIGGNRVMTVVDGVQTSEQFDFGPFNMHQVGLDIDTLKSAEVVRSAGSALYGSDALGGVVSLFTKDPADYLRSQAFHLGGKLVYDGRARDASANAVIAGGRPGLQASLFSSFSAGNEFRNRGSRATTDATRTAPNPQDRRGGQALGKVVATFAPGNVLRGTVEWTETEVDTNAYSSRGPVVGSPIPTDITDITSLDTLRRGRFSVDHRLDNAGGLQQWAWSAYYQQSDVDQVVDEVRRSTQLGIASTVLRRGTMAYEQDSFGGTVQGRKLFVPRTGQALLFTFGGQYRRDAFDMLRDRHDRDAASGAALPNLDTILPSKYFPSSKVDEAGAYLQAEWQAGRLTLVPGIRYDRFSMDPDEHDQVFLGTGSPVPVDFGADAVSARVGASYSVTGSVSVHAQYAGGFRAPPYSSINSGFTNLAAGYATLPNPNLREETSDNFELGVRASTRRASLGVTGFVNRYDGFIQQVSTGFNPVTRVLEFQYQNVAEVTIGGVELRGDLQLTDTLRLRAAYARIRGNDVTGDTDVPLDSIAPDQGILGIEYTAPSNLWGGEALVRGVSSQKRVAEDAFVPPAYGVVDLTGWRRFGQRLTLRAGVLNLTNARYYEWQNVRGRPAGDPVIERYTSPGVSAIVSVGYAW